MSARRRVVITGAGCVTPIGNSVDAFRTALFEERSGIATLPLNSGQTLSFCCAAQVQGFDAKSFMPSETILLTERSAQFGIAAAQQAIVDARMRGDYQPDELAVVMGCAVGGRAADEPEVVKLYTQAGRVHPFTVPRVMASSAASHISMLLHVTGPVLNFSTACASSAHALGHAMHMVRSGMVEAALAGGCEAPLTYGFLKAWEAMRVVSPTGCKPFAAERDGMTLGEGAAVFVLEERERAMRRNARIYAELSGFGMSSDAHHITQPQVDGPIAAMKRALSDAESRPQDVTYINAHGTGTEANDRTEAEAIHAVFGEFAPRIPVSSTKGFHGHGIGAAGAMEVLATILSLQHGLLPVNLGTEHPDSTLRLKLVTQSSQYSPREALSNSFAFGGLNVSLLLRAAS